MKFKRIMLASFSVLSICSCTFSPVDAKFIIYEPAKKAEFVEIWGNEFYDYKDTVKDFSSRFTEKYLSTFPYGDKENVSISPISAYSSLAMASAVTNGDTQKEILDVLGCDYETLKEKYNTMYQGILSVISHSDSFIGEGGVEYKTHLSNSIWIDESVDFKAEALESLSQDFFAYSIKDDFKKKNAKANKRITDFMKRETNGLLNVDLKLSTDTLFVLLNCLYLKDLWHYDGSDIALHKDTFEFENGDKSKTSTKLMYMPYSTRKMYKGDMFTSYFANAHRGTTVYFLKPNDGVELKSVLNAECFSEAINYDYYGKGVDEENKIVYHTSIAFPSFEASCNNDISKVFNDMGVKSLYKSPNKDFFPLTDTDVYISEVKHVTKLKVDRKGIEGAAITAMIGAGAVGPRDGYTDVYEDFVADKAFAYVVASGTGIPLFSGVVNSINKL